VPTTFKSEILIRYPVTVMASIWAIGLTIWTPITIRYNNLDFSSSLDYDPIYLQNIFNTLFWFVPLILILYYSIQIIWILNKRALQKLLLTKNAMGETTPNTSLRKSTKAASGVKRKKIITKRVKFKLQPQVRFLLISKSLKRSLTKPILFIKTVIFCFYLNFKSSFIGFNGSYPAWPCLSTVFAIAYHPTFLCQFIGLRMRKFILIFLFF
jgi:hypothetical protein